MRGIRAVSAHEAYRQALEDVRFGEPVHVRDFDTLEIHNYATEIDEPWHHCHFVPGRRWNPWLALSEALWILAGRDDIKCLLPYNKRIREFSDDGIVNYGAYGRRIREQIDPLLTRLRNNQNDRRSVLSIWREEDLWADTADPPCNDMIMFKIRSGRLHMTVINRSNDLHWGLYGVNLPTFGILQEYLAACLEVEMGTQTHLSNSLHIYTGGPGMKENWRITERMLGRMHEPLPEMPWHRRAFTEPISLDTLRAGCNAVLDHQYSEDYTGIPFLEFAGDFLTAYRLGYPEKIGNECRHADSYADWIKAGEIWVQEGQDRFK